METLTLPSTDGEFYWPPKTEYRFLVLYFYPKDATPGCTTEGLDFTRLLPDFKRCEAMIYGISRDSLSSHQKFKKNQNYTVELIADTESALCQRFEVLTMKKNYGREYLGIDRSTFIVDAQGTILKTWRSVKVPGHAEAVLHALQTLTSQ